MSQLPQSRNETPLRTAKELRPCPFCEGPPVPFVRFTDDAGKVVRDAHIEACEEGLHAHAQVFCHECGAEGPVIDGLAYTGKDVAELTDKACEGWNNRDSRHRDLYDASVQQGLCKELPSLPSETKERGQLTELVEYINALFVSGNDKPVTSTLFGKESWEVIKGLLDEGLPLDYNVVESECVYRRKLAAYGEETRATSPLIAWRAKHRATPTERE